MNQTATTRFPDDVAPAVADLDTIVSLSKRRGFIFASSEIYGGINAVWDYGPLGVELKNNVKRAWWRSMVQERDDIVGLDAGILMHPQVWVTSGHVGSFSDPLVECATDHRRFRLDELPGAEDLSATDLRDPTIVERLGLTCPVDGGPLSAPRRFNLMFKTFMGPVEEDASVIYLRPETAQGSYVNFKNVQQSSRKKLPFGIAQIGKSFRNEISPGNFVFRMREFEQMEMQYFVRPEAEATAAFEEWLPKRRAWYERYGVEPSRLRLREHAPDELAHYAKKAVDVEYRFPFGWKELEGVHNRGDFDLSRHSEASGESLEYFDQATNEHVVPWVVETAAGADGERDRHAFDGHDLADETDQVRDRAAELTREDLEQLGLLFVRCAVVDEHRGFPGCRRQHVPWDVNGQRDRPPGDVDAFDRPAVDVPGERRIARSAVGVLPDPAWAEDVAAADLEQLALDLVRHGDPFLSGDGCDIGHTTDIGRTTEMYRMKRGCQERYTCRRYTGRDAVLC
ncbi:MAG: glycine--tRNA ligase [Chloroflexi bacterium RBG_16_69_14]|nr:MAG: glycine--tRNA ligase [Chloroflexi bacterium RBG_16_69_14]